MKRVFSILCLTALCFCFPFAAAQAQPQGDYIRLHILAESDMISYLPDFVTKDMVTEGKLCYLDVCDFDTEIWKQLIYHKNKWISNCMNAFLEYVKEHEFNR